jgi:hypothetical protein
MACTQCEIEQSLEYQARKVRISQEGALFTHLGASQAAEIAVVYTSLLATGILDTQVEDDVALENLPRHYETLRQPKQRSQKSRKSRTKEKASDLQTQLESFAGKNLVEGIEGI